MDIGQTPRSTYLRKRGIDIVLVSASAVLVVGVLTLVLVEPPLTGPGLVLLLTGLAAPCVSLLFGSALVLWAGRLEKAERVRRGVRLPAWASFWSNHSGKLVVGVIAGSIAAVWLAGDATEWLIPLVQLLGVFVWIIGGLVALVIMAVRRS